MRPTPAETREAIIGHLTILTIVVTSGVAAAVWIGALSISWPDAAVLIAWFAGLVALFGISLLNRRPPL